MNSFILFKCQIEIAVIKDHYMGTLSFVLGILVKPAMC